MKRIIAGLLLVGVLIVLWQVFSGKSTVTNISSSRHPPTGTPEALLSPAVPVDVILIPAVSLGGITYTVFGREIPRGTAVSLLPNFNQRESGQTLAQEHRCQIAINGGFYTKEKKPLGWFVSEGSVSGTLITSTVATGFFWQDTQGKRYLSQTHPDGQNADFILQTGPYMTISNDRLQLVTDEPARRSLLGVDDANRLYVLSVTEKNNTFSGPNLADIPVLFQSHQVQENIHFRTLLNLDGGTASFFYASGDSQSFVLSELTPIGSLICVQG